MAYISKITDLDGSTYDLKSKVTKGILYGEVDSTSTATEFTAQIPGITEYYDGLTILLRNGVVTSASGFTININGLGGKPSYNNMALGNDITPTNPTRDTTIFNINYAMIFVYNTTVVSTGCWICYRGYDANTNTLGYQLRTNSYILKTISRTRYYRLLFTSADNTHWVPANTTYDNSATSVKTPNPVPINPFGEIVYLGNSTSYVAEADVAATAIWQQYTFALGYSFNTTGAALTLTTRKPVYVKCAPQSDGSAIIDSTTPYVQELPSTDDGKIYILLGMAYSATNIELLMNHPVYYYKDGAVRLWTNSAAGSSITVDTEVSPTSTNPIQNAAITNYVDGEISKTNEIARRYLNLGDLGDVSSLRTKDLTSIITSAYGQDATLYGAVAILGSIPVTFQGSYGADGFFAFGELYHADDGSVDGTTMLSAETAFQKNGSDIQGVIIQGVQVSGNTIAVIGKLTMHDLDVDTTPTSGSDNPVSSGGVYTALEGKQDTLYFDTVPTLLSSNPVTSDGIYTALQGKQDTLGIDPAPTSGSTNPVSSGGVYNALEEKSDLFIVGATEVAGEGYYTLDKTFLEIASSILQGKYVIIRTVDVVYHFTTFGYVLNQPALAFGGSVIYDSTIFQHVFVVMQNGNGIIINNTTSLVSSVNGSTGDVALSIPTATSDLTNDSGFITNNAIANMQTTGNLVTSMSSSSTDTQYPSAKLLYDTVGNLESLLAAI